MDSVINAWDLIQIIRTTNITYRSGPPGMTANPNGVWVVVGNLGNELLVAKEGTIVKVPIGDIRKVGSYSKDDVFDALKTVGRFKNNLVEIDMVDFLARQLSWNHEQAKTFLMRFNLPITVKDEESKVRTFQRAQRLLEGGYDG